jgi:hypothetical protein
MNTTERMAIQAHWDALPEDKKKKDANGWQSASKMPGVWYNPEESQFSYDP